MAVLITLSLVILAVKAVSIYIGKAREYLIDAGSAWDRLFVAAKQVIQDDSMPSRMVGFAAAAVICSGCGCFTTRLLIDHFSGRTSRRQDDIDLEAMLAGLSAKQRETFFSVVVNMIYYDTLRTPFRGFLVRRFVFPWLPAAADGLSFTPARSAVSELVESTRRTIETRSEGKRLLHLAH